MERFDATLDRIERRLKEMLKEVENVRLLRQHGPWTALQAYLLRLEDKSERLTLLTRALPCYTGFRTAADDVEEIIREQGAEPATIAVIGGKMTVGCTPEQIEYLGKRGLDVPKASRRDLPVLLARGMDGATTVTTTMIAAAAAGIRVFATGGIGGVHRGAQTTMDISADLEELAQTPVLVQIHPGYRADSGIPGNQGCARAGIPHGGNARLLYHPLRLPG